MLQVDAASAAAFVGKALRLRILVTTAFVFVTFVLRSVVSAKLAVANQFQDSGNRCPSVTTPCDASCHNDYTHIFIYTPEFWPTVVLILSPLAASVVLWGMTPRVLFGRLTYEDNARVMAPLLQMQSA